MSLASFKRKSVVRYGSKRSGKPPGGFWLPQGPFGAGGAATVLGEAVGNYGPVGFSLSGTHRNVGYVGKDSKMSRNGTPYRGVHAIGWGGSGGRYPVTEPIFNVNRAEVLGQQWLYVKPPVLSTKGMLEKKYRWINNGQYPNAWVQPNYAWTNQSATKSQGMYVHNKTTSNMCVTDINAVAKYVGHIKCQQPNLLGGSTAQFTYDGLARNAPYGKRLHESEPASVHTLRIQRRCTRPIGPQKPFPWGTNGDSCNVGGDVDYVVPPAWYTDLSASEAATADVAAAATTRIQSLGPLLQYATSKQM